MSSSRVSRRQGERRREPHAPSLRERLTIVSFISSKIHSELASKKDMKTSTRSKRYGVLSKFLSKYVLIYPWLTRNMLRKGLKRASFVSSEVSDSNFPNSSSVVRLNSSSETSTTPTNNCFS